MLEANTLIAGRYLLEGLVDTGGMGGVYRARDERLHRPVAVKVVHGTDAALAHRLTREAMVLARLDHPNIVRVYDVGVVDGRTFIVTEFVDGTSLHELVQRGPMAPDRVAVIGAGIARALEATHRAGIVHRDLKPANVLITDAGVPRLLDYGIAAAGELARLTLEGQVVGTPRYLSPEQAVGAPVGPPTDIYSLGLVLLECLTGEPSFPGSMAESLAARLAVAPTVPSTLGPAWVALLRRMTAREAADRPSATAVVASLTSGAPAFTDHDRTVMLPAAAPTLAFATAEPPRVTGAATAPARRRRRWVGAVVLVVVMALAVAAGALASAPTTGDGPNGPPSTDVPTTAVTVALSPAPSAVTPTTPAPTTTTTRPGKRGHPPKAGQGGD